MSTAQIVTALLLTGLALAHSLAGETGFIRPLVAASWSIEEVPRWAANRLLRVAWHLTSIAWLALALIVVDADPLVVISVATLASGLAMLVTIPGHPAWPAFLLAGLFLLHAEGLLAGPVATAGSLAAATVLVALALVHVGWAAGVRRWLDGAVPTTADGAPTFAPGRLATVAVAGALATLAGLIVVAATTDQPWFVTTAVLAGVAILGARAVGDGRYAGFTKKERATTFARRDDRWYTPLVVVLAIGAAGAVL